MGAPNVQGQKETWTRFNHVYTGSTHDGYAVCAQCLSTENSPEAGMPCLDGPVAKLLMAQREVAP